MTKLKTVSIRVSSQRKRLNRNKIPIKKHRKLGRSTKRLHTRGMTRMVILRGTIIVNINSRRIMAILTNLIVNTTNGLRQRTIVRAKRSRTGKLNNTTYRLANALIKRMTGTVSNLISRLRNLKTRLFKVIRHIKGHTRQGPNLTHSITSFCLYRDNPFSTFRMRTEL